MKHVSLGGLDVSRIGLGAMTMAGTYTTGAALDDAESVRTIHRALDLGVTHIDTAEIYGPFHSEEIVGKAIRGRRDEVVVATKFGLVSHSGGGPGVVDGSADALPAPDASMDAAVASLVLCSVPDQARALAELHRVLRPGGELRFFEHVRADIVGLARVQRLADLLWPTLVGGCHTSRDTLAAITTAGFEVTSLQRFRFPESRLPQPAAPHVLGVAHRPTSPLG